MVVVTFPELSDDIWKRILGFMDIATDVLHCEQKCRGLRRLIREDYDAIGFAR
jgi:F-box domain